MKEIGKLILTFAKVGVMTFGGGMAMLPILQREVVENKGWATEEELMDYFAIGQCTPGVIAVNTATFIGQKLKGFWGAVFATMGVVFPSLVIISLLAGVIEPVLSQPMITEMSAAGGVMLIATGMNILGLTKERIRVGNMLPAIFLPLAYLPLAEILTQIFHTIGS